VTARLLCRLVGHRWRTDAEAWGGAAVRVCWCARCGRWGSTVAVARQRLGPPAETAYGAADAVAECRRRAA
jgi:hypothetical protein